MTPQELEEEMLSNPVQNLQYMLRRLGTRYSFLPQLATDGLFGEETLEAVMLFQRELAPPVTGVVDGRTWDAIRREWMALEREVAPPRSLRIFPGEGAQMLPGGEEEYWSCPKRCSSCCASGWRGSWRMRRTDSTGTPRCRIPCGSKTWPSWR